MAETKGSYRLEVATIRSEISGEVPQHSTSPGSDISLLTLAHFSHFSSL